MIIYNASDSTSPLPRRGTRNGPRAVRPRVSMHIALGAAALMAASGLLRAEEVTLSYNALSLNADFSVADGNTPTDPAIVIVHGGLAHRDQDSLRYLRSLLSERGHNMLAINLSLGIPARHGLYDCSTPHRHRNADAVDEIDAWVNWLQMRGVQRLTLLGYSRGGAQAALYAAERNTPALQSVVLLAPATRANTDAEGYQKRHGKPLAPILQTAKELVATDRRQTLIEPVGMLWCKDTSATAESFLSYHAENAPVDTPALLPKIAQPVLVIVAQEDELVVDLDKKLQPMMDDADIHMTVIEGSDHWFRDLNADDAADAIDVFLSRIAKENHARSGP